MLRLVLDGTEVDLYENESVNLTLQFSDVQNIQSTTGSHPKANDAIIGPTIGAAPAIEEKWCPNKTALCAGTRSMPS